MPQKYIQCLTQESFVIHIFRVCVCVYLLYKSRYNLFMVLFILLEHAFTFCSFKSFTTEIDT